MTESSKAKIFIFGFLLVFAGIAAYVFLALTGPQPDPPKPPQPGIQPPPEAPVPEPVAPPVGVENPPPPKPAEPEPTDDQIREQAKALSADPELARWLATRHLLGRFASIVENVAHGRSPAKLMPYLEPLGPFPVYEKDGVEYMDPAGYQRYDRLVQAFGSLDAEACAGLLDRLNPWLEKAYRELGVPGRTFQGALGQAFVELLEVPIIEDPIPLERIEVTLKIADENLESMSDAQKHLFRMGPGNIRIVHGKLAEIGRALGLTALRGGVRPISYPPSDARRP